MIVPLCVHDAPFFVERELTSTMASRNVILGKLAEVVVGRLNSDNATSFLLAEWLEVLPREHEHKKWFPKSMLVYGSISICEKFMQEILQSHWISLKIYECVPCLVYGYNYVVGVYSFISYVYLHPGFSYFWGSTSHATADSTWSRSSMRSMRTHAMCIVFHFRYVWMLVDYSGGNIMCVQLVSGL